MKSLLLLAFIVVLTHQSTTDGDMVTTCPRITCSEPLGPSVCFLHSASNPVEWIKLQKCKDGERCDTTQPLAWYDTKLQSVLGSTKVDKSPTWRRQTLAKCEKNSKFR